MAERRKRPPSHTVILFLGSIVILDLILVAILLCFGIVVPDIFQFTANTALGGLIGIMVQTPLSTQAVKVTNSPKEPVPNHQKQIKRRTEAP